jgi:hypothetical protein
MVREDEYWATDSRRTAFPEQAAWRECFPTLETPAVMFDTPEMQARVKPMVKAGDDLITAMQEGKKEVDLSILQLGMAAASI